MKQAFCISNMTGECELSSLGETCESTTKTDIGKTNVGKTDVKKLKVGKTGVEFGLVDVISAAIEDELDISIRKVRNMIPAFVNDLSQDYGLLIEMIKTDPEQFSEMTKHIHMFYENERKRLARNEQLRESRKAKKKDKAKEKDDDTKEA